MVYHVIVALNSVGKRRVGGIISLLEGKGLELVEIRKKITSPRMTEFSDMKRFILQYQLNEMEAMMFYRKKFSPEVLKRKMDYFYGNYVELFFENDGKSLDPNELWKNISKNVFGNGRKLPIMFVVKSGGDNGIDIPFFDQFEPVEPCHFNPRTLVPLG